MCVSSFIGPFADDCIIYCEVTNYTDIALLRNNLQAVVEWCDLWQMSVNTNKCKVMEISHRISSIYSISDIALDSVTCYKYLSANITSNMSWKTHTDHIISNTNSMLGYLRRHFRLAPLSFKTSG